MVSVLGPRTHDSAQRVGMDAAQAQNVVEESNRRRLAWWLLERKCGVFGDPVLVVALDGELEVEAR